MRDRLKALARLLKVLNATGASGADHEFDGETLCVLRQKRSHRFARTLYEEALRRGLVAISEQGRLHITVEGQAALTRLLDPENGFRSQNRMLELKAASEDKTCRQVLANRAESPLERLFMRKNRNGTPWIGEQEFQAGEKLRRDFELAGLQPRITANWVATVASRSRSAGGSVEISDFALDARKRFETAHAAIGPELAGVAMDVCCFLKGLETVERERGWPPRSAKLMLRTALQILARHYGLKTSGGKRAMRQWGSQGYRPEIGSAGAADVT